MGTGIGDHAGGVYFRTGSGRGGDGNPGESLFGRHLLSTRGGVGKIPESICVLGNQHGNALRGIHDGSSSKGDYKIHPVFSPGLRALFHRRVFRIGGDMVKVDIIDPKGLQFSDGFIKRTIFNGRFSVAGNQQGFFPKSRKSMQELQRVSAEYDACRCKAVKNIHFHVLHDSSTI